MRVSPHATSSTASEQPTWVSLDPRDDLERVRMHPRERHNWPELQAPRVARTLLLLPGVMTRFDSTWEPLFVLIAAAVLWFGTL